MNKFKSLLLLSIILFMAGCTYKDAEATHKSLVWNSNTESDMKEYRVYTCSVTPCLASGTPLAIVPHAVGPLTHSFVLPHTDQYYVVYAADTALNVSAPSVTIFANVIPPAAPAGLVVQ